MVSRDNLQEALELQQESQRIQFELGVLRFPGTITAVTYTATPPDDAAMTTGGGVPGPVTIPTIGLVYPPQMLTAIKDQLQKRYDEIVRQLSDLGVTVDQPEARKAKK